MDLPDAVKELKKQNPDCSFSQSIQSTTRIINGQAESSETRDYFMQCPGERKKRVHSQTSNRASGLEEFTKDFGTDFSSGFGSGSSGSVEGFPSVDAFMREFFGMRPGVEEHLRRFPFPLPGPEPRLGQSQRSEPGRRAGEEGHWQASPTPSFPAPHSHPPPPPPPSLAQRERGKGVLI